MVVVVEALLVRCFFCVWAGGCSKIVEACSQRMIPKYEYSIKDLRAVTSSISNDMVLDKAGDDGGGGMRVWSLLVAGAVGWSED